EIIDIFNEGLREKLGCILFQFPGSFKYSDENLERIVTAVPPNPNHVIEFRDESWFNHDVLKAFKKAQLSFCNINFPSLPETFHLTTKTFYLRMHGKPVLFRSPYSTQQLVNVINGIPVKAK